MIDQSISSMRLRKTRPFPSLGPGMFGCKDTQVQAKIVARQLQTMSVVDLLAMMPLVWGAGRCVSGILDPLDDTRGLASIPTGSSEINKKIIGNSMEWKGAMSGFCKDTNPGVLSYTILSRPRKHIPQLSSLSSFNWVIKLKDYRSRNSLNNKPMCCCIHFVQFTSHSCRRCPHLIGS